MFTNGKVFVIICFESAEDEGARLTVCHVNVSDSMRQKMGF